jgi:hypothetical protein
MTTLRMYLETESGTFFSPNHPIPVSGEEMIQALDEGPASFPGRSAFDIDILELPIDVEEQASGDRWVYPSNRNLEIEREPLLIHHPQPVPATER